MNKYLTLGLVVCATVLATAVVTAYVTAKYSQEAFVSAAVDMEAFNRLHRVRSWDEIEMLMTKECYEEALEYARMEQELTLISLKRYLDNGAELELPLHQEHASIIDRAREIKNKGKYEIPTCD